MKDIRTVGCIFYPRERIHENIWGQTCPNLTEFFDGENADVSQLRPVSVRMRRRPLPPVRVKIYRALRKERKKAWPLIIFVLIKCIAAQFDVSRI